MSSASSPSSFVLRSPVDWLVAMDLATEFHLGFQALLQTILNLMNEMYRRNSKCGRERKGVCPAECTHHSICIQLESSPSTCVSDFAPHSTRGIFRSRSPYPKFYMVNTEISVTFILLDEEPDIGFYISKMYFSHWKPPGVSERIWSVNLDGSISGKYQTLGGHSGRPSE